MRKYLFQNESYIYSQKVTSIFYRRSILQFVRLFAVLKSLKSSSDFYRGGMPDNAQLQREFLESLDFLVSLGNASNKKKLNSFKKRRIIDIGSLNKFDYIIPRAAELINGLEFIPLETPSQVGQVRRCLESVEALKTKLRDPNAEVRDIDIIISIDRINERISDIQLNDHKGNLNIFINAPN